MDIENIKNHWCNIKNKLPNIINPNTDKCKLWKCYDCYGVYVFLIIVVIILFIYGSYLVLTYGTKNITTNDFMNKTVFTMSSGDPISWWPISHFILFLILAFLFPGCWLLLLVAGIFWEGFEAVLGRIMSRPYHHVTRTGADIQYKQWMQGSCMDILMDSGGIIVGLLLRYVFDSYRKSNKNDH